jgi:hypothetical protein
VRDDRDRAWDDRIAGRIMLGSILFCAMAGTGVGVFFVEPVVGGLIGAVVGIALGFWLIPNLLREID